MALSSHTGGGANRNQHWKHFSVVLSSHTGGGANRNQYLKRFSMALSSHALSNHVVLEYFNVSFIFDQMFLEREY